MRSEKPWLVDASTLGLFMWESTVSLGEAYLSAEGKSDTGARRFSTAPPAC